MNRTDDGELAALRYDQWKLVFILQKAHGPLVRQNPVTPLRTPLLFSVRPLERAQCSADRNPKRSQWSFKCPTLATVFGRLPVKPPRNG